MTASTHVFAQFSLRGKVAVVTGGAQGLGYEMMLALAEAGADVACIDLQAESGEKAIAEIQTECKVKGSSWGCDVTKEEDVARVFDQIDQYHGRIDILVTAAGINHVCPSLDYPAQGVRKILDVNVVGTFNCMQEVAKHMIQKGIQGSMIAIASICAHVATRPQTHTPYNASKGAVHQLTKSLACEWAPQGIRVTSISPGYFDTAMNAQNIRQMGDQGVKTKQTWEAETPLGRMGKPHELKGAVVFLASDAAAYMTGTDIVVDGGYTSW